MLRLIKVDLASTRQPHLRNGTPWCFLNLGARNVFLREGSHFGFQIAAHELELVDIIVLGRVEGHFRRRQGED